MLRQFTRLHAYPIFSPACGPVLPCRSNPRHGRGSCRTSRSEGIQKNTQVRSLSVTLKVTFMIYRHLGRFLGHGCLASRGSRGGARGQGSWPAQRIFPVNERNTGTWDHKGVQWAPTPRYHGVARLLDEFHGVKSPLGHYLDRTKDHFRVIRITPRMGVVPARQRINIGSSRRFLVTRCRSGDEKTIGQTIPVPGKTSIPIILSPSAHAARKNAHAPGWARPLSRSSRSQQLWHRRNP